MPFATWNTGTNPNDETGDTLRDAFIKLRENFARPALSVLADVAPAADRILYYTGSSTAALATLTPFGRSLIAATAAASARTTLGATTTGSSLFTAADAAAARTALGATATGSSLMTAADATAARATLGVDPSAPVTSLGLKNLNDSDLIGRTVAVNGTADQGTLLNWPSAGQVGTAACWWNVETYGAANRVTQFASFGFTPNSGRTFVRALHDTTWSAWREILMQPPAGNRALNLSQSGTTDVNVVDVRGSPTGAAAIITSGGADAHVDLQITAKGTGTPDIIGARARVSTTEVLASVAHTTAQYIAGATGSLLTAEAPGFAVQGRGARANVVAYANSYTGQWNGPRFAGMRTMGSAGVHSAVGNQIGLAILEGLGSDGVNTYRTAGAIGIEAAGTFSATSAPGRMRVMLTPPGSLVPQSVMIVESNAMSIRPFGIADLFRFGAGAATDVNGVHFTSAPEGIAPVVAAQGSDAIIALVLEAKGNTQVISKANGRTAFSAEAEPTGNSNVYVRGSAANAVIGANGTPNDVDLSHQAKGAGRHFFGTGNGWSLMIETPTAGPVSRLRVAGGVAGSAPVVGVDGTAADIDLLLQPKGNGDVVVPRRILQCAASADQAVGTNPSGIPIQFPTLVNSSGLAWNTTTHRCTPTAAGIYLVTLNCLVRGATASGDMVLMIARNGAEAARWYLATAPTAFAGHAISVPVICNGTTDYIDVRVSAPSAGAVTAWSGRSLSIVRLPS